MARRDAPRNVRRRAAVIGLALSNDKLAVARAIAGQLSANLARLVHAGARRSVACSVAQPVLMLSI